MKILAVFSDEDFKWQKKLFVFIDELDRCEGKYLLDFLAFSNEIFVKGKKKTINNIKIIYLVDQIAGFYRAYHYPQAVPPYGAIERDISTYKKYFEKYWEETFDLKFYVHNIFERINKFKTFSQRKIQSINLKGKKII